MSKFKNFLLFTILLFLTIGCNHKSEGYSPCSKDVNFSKDISLKADSIKIEPIIKAGNIYYFDPYIIVSDVSSEVKRHFHVFDEKLSYLYSFCDYGQGAEECIMPTVVRNTLDTKFTVRDHATGLYHIYDLDNEKATHVSLYNIKEFAPNEFLWEMCIVSDSTILAKGVSPRHNIRRLIDIKTETSIDSIPQTFNLPEAMGKDYYPEFDDFWQVSNGKEFADAYFFINRIEFGTILNNKLKVNSFVGAESVPDFFLYTDQPSNGKYEYNVDNNIVYYEWLTGSEKSVYAGYFGQPWGDIDKHSNVVETYSYSGKPCIMYHLDIPISNAAIIEKMNILVGINPDRSDEFFYVYKL